MESVFRLKFNTIEKFDRLDDEKIKNLNEKFDDMGVHFAIELQTNKYGTEYRQLKITIDEPLQFCKKPKVGRPEIKLDMDKVRQMQAAGMTNAAIIRELKISRATFYNKLKDCNKNNN